MADEYGTYDDVMESPASFAKYWQGQISAALKRRSKWYEQCKEVVSLLQAETDQAFNILSANVETRSAARYNSMPIPDIRPRFFDNSQAQAKSAAQTLERILNQQLDAFDANSQIELAVSADEAFGQAQCRVFWEVDSYTEIDTDEMGNESEREVIRSETTGPRYVPYDRYLEGPCANWDSLPWMAFMVYLNKEDMRSLGVDETILEALSFPHGASKSVDSKDKESKTREGDIGYECAWQVWDKRTRSMILISMDYGEGPLFRMKDPTPRFPGFFPAPKPLQMVMVPGSTIPVCPYARYKKHAETLMLLSSRKQKLLKILRYRGFASPEMVTEFANLAQADDGQFLPTKTALGLTSTGGKIEDAMWAMPIEMLAKTIQFIAESEENQKAQIYELTGIADIMRGATNPNETLGAQNLKATYGSARVQRDQRETQRFIRDILRLMGDVVSTHFADETLLSIEGVEAPQQPQMPPQQIDPMTGHPAPPPPEVQQAMQDYQEAMKRYEEVVGSVQMLKSDKFRHFRIDVETNSTIQNDVSFVQTNIERLMNALTKYGQTFAPMVQSGALPGGPVIKLLQAVIAPFKMGKQAEMALDELFDEVTKAESNKNVEQEQAEQEEQKQVAKVGQQIELQRSSAEAQKAEAEAVGQQLENQQHAYLGPQVAEDWIQ